jgi:hypothetical protein
MATGRPQQRRRDGTVETCGLVIEQRLHHQISGEPVKFLSLLVYNTH